MTSSSTSSLPRKGPLAGIRVLDLTSVVLGPIATQFLGDYGADVIKVESLDGDIMRANGVSKNPGMGSIFLAINRNKRSLAIDLKTSEGVDAVKRLLPTVDVFVHNMRVAAIERLGLGYAEVAALNSRLVYCVATGFGQTGPHAGQPAFDDVIQAASGLASLIGSEFGQPGYAPSLIADKAAGLALVNAVLAGLVHQVRTGEGQHIEVPMFETFVSFLLAEHMGGMTFTPQCGDVGYARLLAGCRKPCPTKDGFLAMLPYTANHWRALFSHVGRDDLVTKYDVDSPHERNARIRELYEDMSTITKLMTSEECLELCRTLDIPATRIYAISELPEHPHLKAVGLFEQQVHPSEGPLLAIRPATLFGRTPGELALPAPNVGQHSAEILQEAGFTAAEIKSMADRMVIR